MIKDILKKSYKQLEDSTKLTRLSIITNITYSIILTGYIGFYLFRLIYSIQGKSLGLGFVGTFMDEIIISNGLEGIGMTLIAVFAISYFFLPPIAEGALIKQINNEDQSIGRSIIQGFQGFFHMFEYQSTSAIFKSIVYIIATINLYSLGILTHPLILAINIIWLLVVIGTDILFAYTPYIITLENTKPIEAMKKSSHLAIENLRLTISYIAMNYFLILRLFINILILIILPFGILYFIWKSEFIETFNFTTVTVTYGIVILIISYLNSIMKGLFISLGYNVYKEINN